jgi:hypothetical protein
MGFCQIDVGGDGGAPQRSSKCNQIELDECLFGRDLTVPTNQNRPRNVGVAASAAF